MYCWLKRRNDQRASGVTRRYFCRIEQTRTQLKYRSLWTLISAKQPFGLLFNYRLECCDLNHVFQVHVAIGELSAMGKLFFSIPMFLKLWQKARSSIHVPYFTKQLLEG